MKDIAIYGGGGFGREVACLINIINLKNPTWNLIGFFDDGNEKGSLNEYGEILGGINELNKWSKSLSVAIAIGRPKIINKIIGQVKNPNIDFPNLIAPDTIFLDKSKVSMGKGNIICSSCFVSTNVIIGDFNIFNISTTIGHDVTIGNCNSLMPAVRISGEITIGNMNFFGVSSVVLQQIHIGNKTVIGANSVILRKTKDGSTYIGNPAKIVKF